MEVSGMLRVRSCSAGDRRSVLHGRRRRPSYVLAAVPVAALGTEWREMMLESVGVRTCGAQTVRLLLARKMVPS